MGVTGIDSVFRPDVPRFEGSDEVFRPCAGMYARLRLVAMMNDDGPGVVRYAVPTQTIAANKRLTRETHDSRIGAR
jgi:hypothetical protein